MNSSTQSIVSRTADAYDSVPYESLPFDTAQPEHLAAIAVLLGMTPVPLTSARVLEIGCAAGGNLLPFAIKHPQAHCIGVDLSERQIRDGQAFIKQFDVQNVELLAMDICKAGDELGQFDYIICHGVFSWVPADVQQGILAACKRLLSENGMAYISYNVFPGWHCWEIGRHLMYRASAHIEDPKQRLAVAMEALRVFSEHASDSPDRPLRQILKEGLKRIEGQPWYYVLHEYLEPCNTPLYFRDFVGHCASNGLRYLGDVQFSSMFRENVASGEADTFIGQHAKHRYDEEELFDYLSGRTFRRSLIVHDHRQLNLAVEPSRLNTLFVSSTLHRVNEPVSGDAVTFRKQNNHDYKLKIRDPMGIAILDLLSAHTPHPVDLPTLLFEYWTVSGEDASKKTDQDILQGLDTIATFLLSLLKKDAVAAAFEPVMATNHISERPEAFALARAQAIIEQSWVCNTYAQVVPTEPIMKALLPMLDGTRTVQDLLAAKQQWLPANEPKQHDAASVLQRNLERMCATSLLTR